MAFEPIRTDRLLLRPVRTTDAGPLAERRSDPDVARYQNWLAPYPLERATAMVAELVEMDGPVDGEWWMLTIADVDDTVVLGDLVVHLTWAGRSAEIGYTLARSAWGHGYAAEAGEALVAHLFDEVGVTRVEAMLHPDNPASAMVLERLGLLFEGHTRSSYWVGDENSDDWIYGMTRSDWMRWADRPREQPDDVALVEVTSANLDAVAALATHKSQERFVAPVLWSLANALVPRSVDGVTRSPWYRAVIADGEYAGFVMLAMSQPGQPEPLLWRLLVDRLHQRRGIGGAVIDLVAAECRSRGDRSLVTSWLPGKGSPEPVYLRSGFVATGTNAAGEITGRLTLT